MKLLSNSASRTDMVLSIVGGGWFWFAFRENPYLTVPMNNMATSAGLTALLYALLAVMLVAIGYTVCSFFISKISHLDRVSAWIKNSLKLLFLLVIFISSVLVKAVESSGLSALLPVNAIFPVSGGLYFSDNEFHADPSRQETTFQIFEIDRTDSRYRQIQQSEVVKFRTEIGTSYLFSLSSEGDLVNITEAGFYRNFGHSMLVARTVIFSEKSKSNRSTWNLTVMVKKNESLFRLECDQSTSNGELPDSYVCKKDIENFLGERRNYFDQFDEKEIPSSNSPQETEEEKPWREATFAEEYKFVKVDLPKDVSIELPGNWGILSDNKTITINSVTESGLSKAGIDTDKSEFSLAATFNNDDGLAIGILNVRYYPTLEITQADASAATDQDVTDLDAGLQEMIGKSLKEFNMTVTSWTGTEKMIINGITVFLTEYRRKSLGSDGDFRVRLVRVLSGNRSVTFTVSYLESAEFLRPITDQIINSIIMGGTKNTSIDNSDDMAEVTAVITRTRQYGFDNTEELFNAQNLDALDDWLVETIISKMKVQFAERGLNQQGISKLIKTTPSVVNIDGHELAFIKVNVDDRVRMVVIFGVAKGEMLKVTCTRNSNHDVTVFSGDCGDRLFEAFGVRVPSYMGGTKNTSKPIQSSNKNTKFSKLAEQNLYAILRVSNPNNSRIQVNIKSDVKSRSFGEVLNKGTWNALKNTCPECVLDYSGVVTKLSPEFELTFTNQSISSTYLQLDKERIIFLGSSAQEGLETCRVMVNKFKQNGRPAKCIQGVQPCPKNDPLGIRPGNTNCTLNLPKR